MVRLFSTGQGSGGSLVYQYAKVVHKEDSGVHGGTLSTGAWRTRPLTDIVTDTYGIITSLATSRVTLEAGTYKIFAVCPGIFVDLHNIKWFNITDTADVSIGLNARSPTTAAISGLSIIDDVFTIASQKVFELQHNCSTTRASDGMGRGTGLVGDNETFAIVELLKVA